MTMNIQAKAGNETCLSFYGPIMEGFYEDEKCFDEAKVAKAFATINPTSKLTVMINSPGGSGDSALAINGILSQHKGDITIHVAGLAASAATLITSLKNAKTVISKGSLMMIHNPMSCVYGNADEMNKEIEVLDKCAESMRSLYKDKTGLSDNKIKELMDAETWLTAEEAVKLGFADELDESEPVTACIKANHILAIAGHEWDLKDLPLPSKEMLMSKKVDPAVTEQQPEIKAPEAKAEEKLMTAQSLQAEHPQLFDAIVAEAVKAERERIKALADIDTGANHDMVVKAMFDEPRTAEQVAIETLKAQKEHAKTVHNALADDAEEVSKTLADNVSAEGALADNHASEREALVKAVHSNLKNLNGYKQELSNG